MCLIQSVVEIDEKASPDLAALSLCQSVASSAISPSTRSDGNNQ